MEASKFKWMWGRKLSDEQACIEALVADAVDAAERGQLAEPSTWRVMRALQKLFQVEILVGENLVSWPPFFPKVVTPRSLQGGTGVGPAADQLTSLSPPPFGGCTTLEEAGPGQIMLLENGLNSQELEKALSQAKGEEMVLVGSWEVMGEAVAKHNAKAKEGRRLSLFHSLRKGLVVSRKSDWWKTGDLEPCKSKSEVGIWWSEATQVRLGGGGGSEEGEEMRLKLSSQLQEELETGEFPELEWDHRLRTGEVWSKDFDEYLSVGPASHLRLDVTWVVAATDGGVKKVPQEAGPDIARLGCGVWYRGYDVDRGNGTRENFAFRGTGGDDSFQAEGEALLKLLRSEKRDQPLAIMYDTDSVIQKVRSQTRDFGAPSPNDPKLRPVVKQILDELGMRTAVTAFCKMKSHADCQGNFGADQLAEEGVQQEDEEADKWRPEDEGELGYRTLGPKGETGIEFLSKRRARMAARQELARQAKLELEAKPEGKKTLTEKWLLRKGAGRQYLRSVWGLSGGAPRVLAKAITFTLPVQVNLHRWFPEKHPSAKCPFCCKENETYSHFTSHCEAFHLLRTREGMTFSKGSIEALGKELKCGEGEWRVRTELTAGRMADEELFSFNLRPDDALRTLRPDGWAWSFKHKCIFVLEHSRMDDTKLESDVDLFNDPVPEELERLKARAEDKVNKYKELVEAIKLRYPEYTVQCAAFIIGAKLSFEEERWRKNLKMFEELTPRGDRRPALSEAAQERIIKRSVLAAARATVNCWHTRLKAPRRPVQ
jgi:ribonuclease HI